MSCIKLYRSTKGRSDYIRDRFLTKGFNDADSFIQDGQKGWKPWVMDRDVLRSSLQHVVFIGHFNKMMFCFLSSVEPDTLYKESTEKTVDNEASKSNEEEPMDEN